MSHQPNICVIGTGFAGLCAGITLKEAGFSNLTIFESSQEVGGTWLVNKYPGCACDVPSHLYCFSFAPNPDWSQHYSSQSEILKYMKDITSQYDLYSYIRFATRVESLQWDALAVKWIAVVHDLKSGWKETLLFDIVVNGTGMLRIPNYPKEFLAFKGELIHSAEWEPSEDLWGKRVGVVGTGASAVQIVPTIVDQVERLAIFQRRAPYIMPKLQFEYPRLAKWVLAKIPGFLWATRAAVFWMHEMFYPGIKYKTCAAKLGKLISSIQRGTQILNNEALLKKMTPDYEFGCKRILPSNEYYPALQKSNVDVICSKIVKIADREVTMEDGMKLELDVLILATGYKPHEYFAPLSIHGKENENILDSWKTLGPRTYLGIVSSSLPNYFTLMGPHSGLGHNSHIFIIECQVQWMLKVLKEMQRREANYVCVKREPEQVYMNWHNESHKTTVWGNANCGSWYVSPEGKIDTLYPGNLISYWKLTSELNSDALSFK